MLKWFVNDEVAIQVQRNMVLIEEEQVEVRPEPPMDENVDVNLIRTHFCNDAWLLVQEVVALLCKHCSYDVHKFASLACDHCLSWFQERTRSSVL